MLGFLILTSIMVFLVWKSFHVVGTPSNSKVTKTWKQLTKLAAASVIASVPIYLSLSLLQYIRAYPTLIEGVKAQLSSWAALPANLLHVPLNLALFSAVIWVPLFIFFRRRANMQSSDAI